MDLRRTILIIVPVAAFATALVVGPLQQSPAMYDYADRRSLFAIPNFMDVVSNLAFLAVGAAGLWLCLRRDVPGARGAWMIFFFGMVGVAMGSANYHLTPSDGTLVWDRVPMTIAFTAAYAALIGEAVKLRLAAVVLPAALAVAAGSVFYWYATGNIAPYFTVQATVFATAIYLPVAFAAPWGDGRYVYLALGLYALAIVCERFDHEIFALTGSFVSGHTVKHLFAALAAWAFYRMLARRVQGRP